MNTGPICLLNFSTVEEIDGWMSLPLMDLRINTAILLYVYNVNWYVNVSYRFHFYLMTAHLQIFFYLRE